MKSLIALVMLFLACPLFAEDGPKVYIDSINKPYEWTGFLGGKHTSGEMASASQIESEMKPLCSDCKFIQKKENADYVVTFWSDDSLTNWSVASMKGDGKMLATKKNIFNRRNAYKDTIKVMMDDWNKSK
jgi:hypothetical protein